MYSLSDYGSMISDRTRSDAYAYALKQHVRPDSVVLDIGAGTGIHTLLACKFGARRVYAVEPNGVVHLLRDLARANGFADRIELIQDVSTAVALPERADVIVSDLRGVLPPFGEHIPSIIDARQRHLAPGGVLIPRRDTLWVALVEARDAYAERAAPWDRPYALDMDPARRIALNAWGPDGTEDLGPRELLTEPVPWAVLDYETVQSPDVRGTGVKSTVTRDGTAHGLLIWFDAELTDGIGYSNGPRSEAVAAVYGRGFFPFFEPVPVSVGDTVTLGVGADLRGGSYVWHWKTRVSGPGPSAPVKADFAQSTADLGPLSPRRIAEQLEDTRRTLSDDGRLDLLVLTRLEEGASLGETAREAMGRFPGRFVDQAEALVHVYDLSQQYVE